MGRLPGERLPEEYVTIAPDLAVEVVSPTNLAEEMEEKIADYFGAGVPLVWIVFPNRRLVHVRRPDGSNVVLNDQQSIDGGPVLAGFTCPVKSFFEPAERVTRNP